jgi:hypothetical protein
LLETETCDVQRFT